MPAPRRHRRQRRDGGGRPGVFWLLALLLAGAAGCRTGDDAVRAEVQRLTLAEGDDALAQAQRIARLGRQALPAIESALHVSDEPGRKNLILALRRLGEADAVPLLLHVAAYDAGESVRREAEWTLRDWARNTDARAERARAALRRLDELKATEATG